MLWVHRTATICLLIWGFAFSKAAVGQVVQFGQIAQGGGQQDGGGSGALPAIIDPRRQIAVIENSPGAIWNGHQFYQGMNIEYVHPDLNEALYDFHATAVGARVFQAPADWVGRVDAGLADRGYWQLGSYQTTGFDTFNSILQSMAGKTRIATHSVGYISTTDGNSARSRALDRAVFEDRLLFLQAAHNEGPFLGTLLDPAAAYNGLTVAASGPAESTPDDDFYRGLASDDSYVAWYSSRGPTADGRAKPDLTAPGTFIVLPDYRDGVSPLDPTWTKFTGGTSFSAPYVAGLSAELMQQADALGFNSDPLVLKSVLMNSAQEIRFQKPSRDGALIPEVWDGWSPTRTNKPLDWDQGAGEVNLVRARQQYFQNGEQSAGGNVARLGWDQETSLAVGATEWYYFEQPVHQGATLTATLNWFREMEGIQALGLDNLDLELWKTDGERPTELVTLSNSLIDNVEHIHRFSVPETSFYALGVRFKQSHTAQDSDAYGLAWMLPDSHWMVGDVNLDGRVDDLDMAILVDNFHGPGGLYSGDVDWDHDVDLQDFAMVRANYVHVPEPAIASMMCWAALACMAAARRK